MFNYKLITSQNIKKISNIASTTGYTVKITYEDSNGDQHTAVGKGKKMWDASNEIKLTKLSTGSYPEFVGVAWQNTMLIALVVSA